MIIFFKLIATITIYFSFYITALESNYVTYINASHPFSNFTQKYARYGAIGYNFNTVNRTNSYTMSFNDIESENPQLPARITSHSSFSKVYNLGKLLKSLAFKPINICLQDLIIGNSEHPLPSPWNDMKVGMRLFVYNKIFTIIAANIILSRLKNFDLQSSPPQFAERPSFRNSVIIAPIIEELIFTYGLRGMVNFIGGPIAAQIIIPTIFALGHCHQSPELQKILRLSAGFQSFISIRNICINPSNICASLFSHMLNNGIVHILCSKK